MLIIFFLAYGLVAIEDVIHLRKSKPVMLAAGLIWALLGIVYAAQGEAAMLEVAAKQVFLDYGELMLFIIVAVTYVNTMEERRLFDVLRSRVVSLRLSYRQLFWLVGGLAFVFGPVIDNLTTALVMGAVVMAVGAGNSRFIVLACINVVVAANAGGVFSPFGDITSLMVWQKGKLEFLEFFNLFLPALVNFIIPAVLMQYAVPKGVPEATGKAVGLKPGAAGVIWLFGATIATAIIFRNYLHLPPALGMMLGLGYLQAYSYVLQRTGHRRNNQDMVPDSFKEIERVEWDTLLFFFGIIFAVGAGGGRPPGAGLGLPLRGHGADRRQHRHRRARRGLRQYPANVRGADHGSGHVERAVDADHAEHRRRGEPGLHRHGGGSGADGHGARPLHLPQPPALDLGHRPRLRRERRHAPVGQRRPHLTSSARVARLQQGGGRMRRGSDFRRNSVQSGPIGGRGRDLLLKYVTGMAVAAGLIVSPLGAAACEGLTIGPRGVVASVTDGDTVILDNGLVIRLIGTQAPKLPLGREGFPTWPMADEAKAALEDMVLGQRVELRYGGERVDRHGRALGHLFVAGAAEGWVQERMLAVGLARVYSFPDNRACLAELMAAETRARTMSLGIWTDPYYTVRRADRPEALASRIGHYELVGGRVLLADEAGGRVSRNFGRYWKEDFTAVIERCIADVRAGRPRPAAA